MSKATSNPMILQVMAALYQDLGIPKRKTVKVLAWEKSASIGIVLDTYDKIGQIACIWVPDTVGQAEVPMFAQRYAPDQGRNSNTYASPGLQEGKASIKLMVRTQADLEGARRFIASL